MPEQTLAGKVAIVSGSSSGISAGIVHELSARGASMVINFPFPHLEAKADTLMLSLPSPAILVEADMLTILVFNKLVDV